MKAKKKKKRETENQLECPLVDTNFKKERKRKRMKENIDYCITRRAHTICNRSFQWIRLLKSLKRFKLEELAFFVAFFYLSVSFSFRLLYTYIYIYQALPFFSLIAALKSR